jgi:hypothetical protein
VLGLFVNPYRSPESHVAEAPRTVKDVPVLTNLLGLLLVLPGFMGLLIALAAPETWSEEYARAPLETGFNAASAAASLMAGGLLFALRRVAITALAVASAIEAALVAVSWPLPPIALGLSALPLIGLVYTLWLRQAGYWRQRPNNSSKPTPLRGAA